MTPASRRFRAGLAAAAALLAACSAMPAKPLLEAPFAPAAGQPAPVPTTARWWERLGDPALDALVERALAGNLSLQAARVRVNEARGLEANTPWRIAPQASYGGLYQGTHAMRYEEAGQPLDTVSGFARTTTQEVGVSWELPLFGAASATRADGRAGADRAYWQHEALAVAVTAEVVRAYADWQAALQATAQARSALAAARALESGERAARREGSAPPLAVDRRHRDVTELREAEARALAARDHAVARLAVLTGTPSPALPEPAALPRLTLPGIGEVRAETLRLRPDVRAEEAKVLRAAAEAGLAQAALYPQLNLGGALILNSGALDLYGGTRGVADIVNLSGAISIPLLDWFPRHAVARARRTEWEAVVLDYRQTVLLAWEEARRAAADHAEARVRYRASDDRRALDRRALAGAEARVHEGSAPPSEAREATLRLARSATEAAAARRDVLSTWARLTLATFISPEPAPAPVAALGIEP